MDINQLVYSLPVIEFVAVANEYCKFIENVQSFSKHDFLVKSAKILPLLYYKTSLIPIVDSAFDEGNEKYLSQKQYELICLAILKKLGSHNDYQEVFDPVFRDARENHHGSLALDFADIYQDVKDFIMVYRFGTVEIMQEALFEIRTTFEEYWGQRLVNALRVIHSLITRNSQLDDETEGENQPDRTNWIFSRRQKMWNEDE